MLSDAHGNAVSTRSRPALEASERALWRMMSFYGTPIDDLDAAVAADPGWALPQAMKAGFLLGLTEAGLHDEAVRHLAEAARLASDDGGANERERRHIGALQRLAAGDWPGAGALWHDMLEAHPRDALALQWGHLVDFYRGDAALLRARIERALPAWRSDDPLQPYVLGLHAFGLEESGRHDEAEATGREALAGAARVPWAIHAVGHVMEMQGRHDEGRRWLADWRRDWGEDGEHRNGFAGHLGWHEALFALEARDHAGALAAFDAYLDASAHEITLQRVDAASLLWRLRLHGADVGDRFRALVAGWPLDPAHAGRSAFNDVHALLALVGAGDLARAEAWRAASLAGSEAGDDWNRGVMRDIGAPLMAALLDFGRGRYDAAAERLAAVRRRDHDRHDGQGRRGSQGDGGRLARLGGSHAQRDVVDQTLLAAAARGSLRSAGRDLLAHRARPPSPLGDWWAARLS